MSQPIQTSRALWPRLRRSLSVLMTGGDWALALPPQGRRNLQWYWLDGFFAAATDNIVVTYLTLYVLALGASRAQIGLLSSLSSLGAALILLPGALLVERLGHRMGIALLSGSGSRIMLLLLALIPLVFDGPALVYIAIFLAVGRDLLANLAYPAWMAITADVVPLAGRGRYFAARNFAMGFAGMAVTLLAGELITRANQPAGHQVAFLVAGLLGLTSSFCFGRLHDPRPALPVAPGRGRPDLAAALRGLAGQPGFLALIGTTALWNFSLNVAGPFFTVYLVQNLHASATLVGVTSIASSLASLLAQRKIGDLADRWGSWRLQLVSSLVIPILPTAWIFINSGWQVIPINLLGGALWGAYSLASFNLLLAMTPQEFRARFSAVYQITVMLSLAAGAAVGGVVVTHWGYPAIFAASAVGRLAAAFLFARFVRPESPFDKPSPSHYDG